MLRAGAMLFALAVFWSGVSAPVFADPASRRNLSAQLLIIQGDVKRLGLQGLPASQRQGLEQRIRGLLGGLAWQFRQQGDAANGDRARAFATTPGFKPDEPAFAGWVDQAVGAYPFPLTGLNPDRVLSGARPKALAIHETFCAGCHDGTPEDLDVPLPALDLYAMAGRMSAEEFLARMLNGVRGDQVTGLANPLSDAQMAALTALYRGGGN